MEPHSSSPPGQYGLGNRRRYSQLSAPQMQRFPAGRSSQLYADDAVDQPQHSPTTVDGYDYPDMARGRSQGNWYGGGGIDLEPRSPSLDLRAGNLGPSNAVGASYDENAITDRHTPSTPSYFDQMFNGPVWTGSQGRVFRPQQPSGYPKNAGSDIVSRYTQVPPDSGYRSFQGSGQLSQPGDDVQSMVNPSDQMRMPGQNATLNYGTNMSVFMGSRSDTATTYAGQLTDTRGWEHQTPTSQRFCEVSECKEAQERRAMGHSEYKKHMSRHERPWVCQVSGCKRSEKGFATRNDLGRHLKSVHNKLSENCNDRSFICVGKNCTHQGKVWPRLDNFKAHCKRVHGKEDVDELIRSSEIDARTQRPPLASTAGSRGPASETVMAHGEPEDPALPAQALLDLSQSQTATPRASQTSPTPGPPNREIVEAEIISVSGLNWEPGRRIAGRHRRADAQGTPETSEPPETFMKTNRESPLPSNASSIANSYQPPPPSNISSLRSITLNTPGIPETRPNSSTSYQNRIRLRNALENKFVAAQAGRDPLTTEEMVEVAFDCITRLSERFSTEVNLDGAEISAVRLRGVAEVRQLPFPRPRSSAKRPALEAGVGSAEPAVKRAKGSAVTTPSAKPTFKCSHCGEIKERKCDLKKHEKRHTRPWGCTNKDCDKAFGSKNDWKRHENSQHERLQMWRCQEPSEKSRIGICTSSFSRPETFRAHLQKEHKIQDEAYMKEQSRQARIGRNWQDRFWCGFCRRIIKLHHKGLQAWDERFNHIDNEHFNRGERIDSWYPLDSDRPKGELLKAKGQGKRAKDVKSELSVSDDESEVDTDRSTSSDPSPSPSGPPPPSPPPRPHPSRDSPSQTPPRTSEASPPFTERIGDTFSANASTRNANDRDTTSENDLYHSPAS